MIRGSQLSSKGPLNCVMVLNLTNRLQATSRTVTILRNLFHDDKPNTFSAAKERDYWKERVADAIKELTKKWQFDTSMILRESGNIS